MTQFVKNTADKAINERLLNFLTQIYESLKANELLSITDLNLSAIARATNFLKVPSQDVLMRVDWSVKPTMQTAEEVHRAIIEANKPKVNKPVIDEETQKRIDSLEDEILELRDEVNAAKKENMVLRNTLNSSTKVGLPKDARKMKEELDAALKEVEKAKKETESIKEQHNILSDKYTAVLAENEKLKKSYSLKSEEMQKYYNLFNNFAKDINAVYEKYERPTETK